jgi:acetyl esterase/lipase
LKARYFISSAMVLALMLGGCTYKSMQKFTLKTDYMLNVVKKPPAVANYSRDVVWASPGGENLLLDVSWPEGDGPYPIVVNIHGGAFFLDTKAMDEALCRYLTNRDYTVFNINYRLAPQHKFPAAVNDSLGAIIWAKAHAKEYKGDPSRVAVSGGSAGGNLVGMVALAWDDPFFTPTVIALGLDASVQAAVPIFAVFDMTAMSHPGDKGENPYIGGKIEDRREMFEKASPIYYLDRAGIPPMMLVCGDKDGLYPQSQRVVDILRAKGVPYEFYSAPGRGHAFTNWHWQADAQKAYSAIADWLDRQFK